MQALKDKRVLIGITGGIAVYKVAQLVRELRKFGAQVKVIMTSFAQRFVSKLTFETLSMNKVYSDWEEDPLAHINLARWAQVFLIAPCTVNTLSKIALGIGDNLLTTTVLAYRGKLLIAPAANTVMYKNPAVQENLRKLSERGAIIIEPEWGVLACDEEGEGKLANIERLIDWIVWAIYPKKLEGKKILVTCGATREYIDPVRFISNDSSGEMGFSLARVARWMGAQVKVIAGFTTAKEPPEIRITRVKTTQDMRKEVLNLYDEMEIVIMNSAVADYRPKRSFDKKLKKQDSFVLELEKNPDILKELGTKKENQVLIGFALESNDILENGRKKLEEKNLDAIVANPVDVMGSSHHRGLFITRTGVKEFSFRTKLESAEFILNEVARI